MGSTAASWIAIRILKRASIALSAYCILMEGIMGRSMRRVERLGEIVADMNF
jgi:hypothetical protein